MNLPAGCTGEQVPERATFPPAGTGRILLVEDDPEMGRLIAWVLRNVGYDVVSACGGAELLSYAQDAPGTRAHQRPFDAIVSDVMLPDLSAFDVLDALRTRGIATPAVLITAYGAANLGPDASAVGVRAILDKPLDWIELCRTVRETIAGGPATGSRQTDRDGREDLPATAR